MTPRMDSKNDQNSPGGARSLWRRIRRRWLIVVVCLLVAPIAAVAVSLMQPKRYSASATLLFRDPALDQKLFGSSTFAPSGDPAREAATNLQLVSLKVVAERTAKTLGLPSQQVRSSVNVAP